MHLQPFESSGAGRAGTQTARKRRGVRRRDARALCSRDRRHRMNLVRVLAALVLMLLAGPLAAQEKPQVPHVSAGTIADLGVLKSKYADPRRVVVWLASGYRAHGPKYAVLSMHDGQNLFAKATVSYGMEW